MYFLRTIITMITTNYRSQKEEALNYDHPKSIDFELLVKHVKALKRGET